LAVDDICFLSFHQHSEHSYNLPDSFPFASSISAIAPHLMPAPVHLRNVFFPLTVVFSFLFIVTILALFAATLFGDPRAPAAQLLDRFVGWILTGEVAGILLTGFAALVVDRRQTLAAQLDSVRNGRETESPHE
jgi:hypothetical protein